MTKHTPGPWDRTNLTIHTKSTAERGALGIARVFEAGIETEAADSVDQATANANLIAAAPALRKFIDQIARMETAEEYDERTNDDGMSGDDAVDTLSGLIRQARELTESRCYS
jgi:hypothetical protein